MFRKKPINGNQLNLIRSHFILKSQFISIRSPQNWYDSNKISLDAILGLEMLSIALKLHHWKERQTVPMMLIHSLSLSSGCFFYVQHMKAIFCNNLVTLSRNFKHRQHAAQHRHVLSLDVGEKSSGGEDVPVPLTHVRWCWCHDVRRLVEGEASQLSKRKSPAPEQKSNILMNISSPTSATFPPTTWRGKRSCRFLRAHLWFF